MRCHRPDRRKKQGLSFFLVVDGYYNVWVVAMFITYDSAMNGLNVLV